jgi:hypothetical protein
VIFGFVCSQDLISFFDAASFFPTHIHALSKMSTYSHDAKN